MSGKGHQQGFYMKDILFFRKRSGRVVKFNQGKIASAIARALKETQAAIQVEVPSNTPELLAQKVCEELNNPESQFYVQEDTIGSRIPKLEDVQDAVETVIVVEPSEMPFTMPSCETDATLGLEEVHVKVLSVAYVGKIIGVSLSSLLTPKTYELFSNSTLDGSIATPPPCCIMEITATTSATSIFPSSFTSPLTMFCAKMFALISSIAARNKIFVFIVVCIFVLINSYVNMLINRKSNESSI